MFSWKITVRKTGLLAKDAGLARAEVNELFRQALRFAGIYWIENFLRLHFLPSAVQRYSYTARSARTQRTKRRAAREGSIVKRDFRTGRKEVVPFQAPASPLVWTGDMKREIFSKPAEQFNIKATATANRQRLRVPVKFGHPMNAKHAGEVVRATNAEYRTLRGIATNKLRELLGTLGGKFQRTEKLAA